MGKVAISNRSEQTKPDPGPEQPARGSRARSPGASSGSELKRVVDAAAQRVDEIVDGAERVASGIIAEAETEAERYLEGRRRKVEQAVEAWSADLRGLTELVGQQRSRLTELTRSMLGELEEVAAVLGRIPPELDRRRELFPESRSDATAGPSASASGRPEPTDSDASQEPDEPASRDARPEPEPPDRAGTHGRETALLRAAQMAVAGSSREEIERALSAEFEIREPTPIVDQLLGPRG